MYSFMDIKMKYEYLTETERNLCTKEEFEKLILWLKEIDINA